MESYKVSFSPVAMISEANSFVLQLCMLSFFGVALSACDNSPNSNMQSTLPVVTVSQPIRRSISEWDEYSGRFAAVNSIEVRARVSGYLDSVHFEDGQFVKKGDLLFVIDPRPFQIAKDQAEAEFVQAEARLDLATGDLERAGRLIERGAISQEIFDKRVQVKRETGAAVAAAGARVRWANLNLEFTRVSAPVAGRASRRFVTVGNLVNGGTADSTLLTTIVTLDPIHFYFDTDETAYLKYVRLALSGERPSARTTHTPVYLALPDEDEYVHEGHIDFIDNQIDFSSGTVRTRAIFDNPDLIFIPGLFARIQLSGRGEYEALLLSDEVIGMDQSRNFVYVVDKEDTVIYRQVQLGPLADGLRVVRSGLNDGEWVVVKGIQRVRHGTKVNPQREPIDATVNTASAQ